MSGLPKRIGVALFEIDGKPGPGFAAFAPEDPGAGPAEAFPIRGVGDLASDAMWVLGLDYETMRDSALSRSAHLRGADYLKPAVGMKLAEEIGISDSVGLGARTGAIAAVLGRVLGVTTYAWPRDAQPSWSARTLALELEAAFPDAEMPGADMAAATRNALQEYTMAQIPQPKGGRSITLRAPRVAHAREMLAQPVPLGPWKFRKREALPKGAELVEWLMKGPPVIARISIANLAPEVAEIFAWGSGAKDDDGKPMVRHWATTPELLTLAHFTDLDIDAAWVGTGYGSPMPVPAAVDPARATPTAHASISFGLVSEAIWGAACRRAPAALVRAASGYGGKGGRHGGGSGGASSGGSGGGKRPALGVAFRALWIRAADRAAMFRAAAGLRSQGWAVAGYGAGGVTVCALPEALAEVVRDGLAEGLAPAPGVAARFGLPTVPANAKWGGEPLAAADARLRASGQGGLLLKLDAVPFLPPARRAALLAELAQGAAAGSSGGAKAA